MKKRIQIDGVWFVEESTTEKDFDVTFTYQATSGIFDYSVLLNEVDEGKRFEANTEWGMIEAYTKGRNEESQLWDNPKFLRDVRDGIYRYNIEEELTAKQLSELQNLLIAVTEKGWL